VRHHGRTDRGFVSTVRAASSIGVGRIATGIVAIARTLELALLRE
jgi:hypothetical protein